MRRAGALAACIIFVFVRASRAHGERATCVEVRGVVTVRTIGLTTRALQVEFGDVADAALTEACWTPANACASDGCARALFAWANATSSAEREFDASLMSRERALTCLVLDIEEYARFIPLNTLVSMHACDYSTLLEEYPSHLSGFDLSQFSAREFIDAVGPEIPKLLAIQRATRLARVPGGA